MLMTQSARPAAFSTEDNTQSYNSYTETQAYQGESVAPYPGEESQYSSSLTSGRAFYTSDPEPSHYTAQASSGAANRRSPTLMNGLLGNAPQAVMYVRALYDYEADDRTSLSFHEGDIIQVITQLESGWWDGVINGVRGWFPSNYCQVITNQDEVLETKPNGHRADMDFVEDEEDDADEYEDHYDDDEDGDSERDDMTQLPIESNHERTRADFWIPQATSDGRLFYFNTETGESSMELPLESPSSATENGPRDRMNVNIPEKTRPPAEVMARGYIQDEDYESEGNSASELEGESLMLGSRSSFVSMLLLRVVSDLLI